MAFEQLESVWPVHGSVLILGEVAQFVAGRSCFLDGGLRLIRLNVKTGDLLTETLMDDRDPDTGRDLQERLQTLQMPVGLPDVLSSDGKFVYMRSQQFTLEGSRLDLGPHSGQPAEQGSVQRGEAAHLFSPTGFLDGTYFHRSYWVYGRSFAGGHSGYFQAGKYAPSGRLLVFDDENVYGFGRKPEYLRWTTTIEHQLFSANKVAPEASGRTGGKGPTMVRVEKSPSLNPQGKALAVEAWVQPERPEGVIVARGGPAVGFALVLRGGRPQFVVRSGEDKLAVAAGKRRVMGRWSHLVGVLTEDRKVELYVDGERVASTQAKSLLPSDPAQAMEIGADDKGSVGDYRSPLVFTGVIDEVRLYFGKLTADEIAARAANPRAADDDEDDRLALAYSFDGGRARDLSGKSNNGVVQRAKLADGKVGKGLRFDVRSGGGGGGGSFVKPHWTKDIPLMARAMLLAGDKLFIAGPPDLIDEEDTFQRTVSRDPKVAKQLAQQDAALRGEQGGVLLVVSASTGEQLAQYELDELPVWDGLVAANGKLYLTTEGGHVVAFEAR